MFDISMKSFEIRAQYGSVLDLNKVSMWPDVGTGQNSDLQMLRDAVNDNEYPGLVNQCSHLPPHYTGTALPLGGLRPNDANLALHW